MHNKITPISSVNRADTPRVRRKHQQGQSLMEFALSVTLLILLFSGAIDLGRAFMTRIILDTAVSEGAHWVAAYPGCLLYGAAFGDESNVVNAPASCQGTNSIFTRIRNESDLLLPGSVTGVWLTKPTSRDYWYQVQPGDTFMISVSYKVPLITPLMQAMFGDTLSLQVNVQEVVRGTTLPITTGQPSTFTPTSSVQPIQLSQTLPTTPSQGNGTTTIASACNNAYATIQYKEPATGTIPDRYKVYEADAGTGALGALINTQTTTGGGSTHIVPITTATHPILIETGGNQLYGIQSEKDNPPATPLTSDIIYILVTCTQVQPTLESATCSPTVGSPPPPSPSVDFTWTLPSTFAWSKPVDVDTTVTSFTLYLVDPVGGGTTAVQTYTGLTPTLKPDGWTYTGTLPLPPPPDPAGLRTGTYRIQANVGAPPDSALDLAIDCP